MNDTDKLKRLGGDPGLYLREIDLKNNRALFTAMTPGDYRASTFLGGPRLVSSGVRDLVLPLDAVVEYCTAPSGSLHFLFHIGHCGSTLLARMLGELAGCFSLREPRPLMSLAWYRRYLGTPGYEMTRDEWRRHLYAVLNLLSRTFDSGDVAIVKPNSHSNNLMDEEMAWARAGRAVLVQVKLETWLATVLKPAKRQEIEHFSALRIQDLGRRLPGFPGSRAPSGPELAAVIWVAQLMEFQSLLEQSALQGRCTRLDFDAFLEDPEENLRMLAATFACEADRAGLERALALVDGEHAKRPGQRYSRAVRSSELQDNRRRASADIRRARDFALTLCREYPTVETAVARWL